MEICLNMCCISDFIQNSMTCWNILYNKLGRRQSQTPFSSAFWVQKDFVSKVLGKKNFSSKKSWRSITNLGSRLELFQLNLSMLNMFWFVQSWLDLPWLDLSWLNLSLLDFSWLKLSWLDLSWLDLSWLAMSWLALSWPALSWPALSWLDHFWLYLFWPHPSWLIKLPFGRSINTL